MKNKFAFIALMLVLIFSSCSAQKLDISIESNLKKADILPVYYWVSNNTGEDIPDVEYILNDSYFYKSSLPSSGDSLSLFEFAKQDGTRYDFFSVKPVELKVKSKKGFYSIRFDDIPLNPPPSLPPVSDEYREVRDVLEYYNVLDVLRVQTMDKTPATLVVKVVLGYTYNDKSTPQELTARKVDIIDFLSSYFKTKTVAELQQEKKIKIEIRNKINDNILTKNKIKDVLFTQYDIVEP